MPAGLVEKVGEVEAIVLRPKAEDGLFWAVDTEGRKYVLSSIRLVDIMREHLEQYKRGEWSVLEEYVHVNPDEQSEFTIQNCQTGLDIDIPYYIVPCDREITSFIELSPLGY